MTDTLDPVAVAVDLHGRPPAAPLARDAADALLADIDHGIAPPTAW
jgi:hypothetical protein